MSIHFPASLSMESLGGGIRMDTAEVPWEGESLTKAGLVMFEALSRIPQPCKGQARARELRGWPLIKQNPSAPPSTPSPGPPLLSSLVPARCSIPIILLLISRSRALDQKDWSCNSPKCITSRDIYDCPGIYISMIYSSVSSLPSPGV